ncbi:hypothetical protein Tco_1435390 [Tanacetum coccineum]
MVTESLEHAVLAKESSRPQSSYEAAASLTEFELKKILIDKIDKIESNLAVPEHKECYDGLIKSYDLEKSIISTYEDPSVGLNRWLKKRKTSKDAKPTKGPKAKESRFGSSKGTKSQLKSSGKRDWFTKPIQPQEPTNPNWNDGKTPQLGPTQSWLMTLASSADKPSKTFDELMSTPIYFSAYIMNGLNITNLTQETLLGVRASIQTSQRHTYQLCGVGI